MGMDVPGSAVEPEASSAVCGSKSKWGSCLLITFPPFELGLILTSDDKDPNNGNLFGEG